MKFGDLLTDGEFYSIVDRTLDIKVLPDGIIEKDIDILSHLPITHWTNVAPFGKLGIELQESDVEKLLESINWINNHQCTLNYTGPVNTFTVYLSMRIAKSHAEDERFLASRDALLREKLHIAILKLDDSEELFQHVKDLEPSRSAFIYLDLDGEYEESDSMDSTELLTTQEISDYVTHLSEEVSIESDSS